MLVEWVWVIAIGLAAARSAQQAWIARKARKFVERNRLNGAILVAAWGIELNEAMNSVALLCLVVPGVVSLAVDVQPSWYFEFVRWFFTAAAVLLFVCTETRRVIRQRVIEEEGGVV